MQLLPGNNNCSRESYACTHTRRTQWVLSDQRTAIYMFESTKDEENNWIPIGNIRNILSLPVSLNHHLIPHPCRRCDKNSNYIRDGIGRHGENGLERGTGSENRAGVLPLVREVEAAIQRVEVGSQLPRHQHPLKRRRKSYWSSQFPAFRDLPQYGHRQWQTYFGRTFDVYTKLWKFQQQHRIVLDSNYGLKRWQIGEIASKIGQLYYHY